MMTAVLSDFHDENAGTNDEKKRRHNICNKKPFKEKMPKMAQNSEFCSQMNV